MDDPTLQPGADGEIPEGLSVEWPDKPKKKRPLSPLGRRARSLMRKALLVIPVATISIFLTLLMTHNIDLNALPVFRRACLATLGSNRIAFSTFKQSDSLYLADVDNSRICGLVYGRVDVTFWSPDRKYIGYSPSIFKNEIHLVDTQSGDQRLIVGSGAILAWSPNGGKILYRTQAGEKGFLGLMNPDGSNPQLLGEVSPSMYPCASFSPDGRSIVFCTPDLKGLMVVTADGSNLQQIANGTFALEPRWSPDGQHILFQTSDPSSLILIDPNGSNQRVLALTSQFVQVAWSPDGKTVAFEDSSTNGSIQIDAVNVDGSNFRTLITDSDYNLSYSTPAWSPDGKTIAYLGVGPEQQQNVIKAINADGSDARVLVNTPPSLTLSEISWSP